MFVWDDVVGRHEDRMTRMPRLHQIALAVVCVDGALSRMADYLAHHVPSESIRTVEQAIEALWEFLAASQREQVGFSEMHVEDLQAINPGEDDPVLAPGWGQLLDATLRACDMAKGEDPKELILDCLGYAYQGVLEMTIRLEGKGANITEQAVRNFEIGSSRCQAEMQFQLASLHALESGGQVESAVVPGRRFPVG